MQRPDELPAAAFVGIAETCLRIAEDVEKGTSYSDEYKRPAIGGLIWDAFITITTALGIVHAGNSNFVSGRANVQRPIVRRLDRERPELRISRRIEYVGDLHTLEHAGQMRRGSYEVACWETGELLAILNSLLPAELQIEARRFAWLAEVPGMQ